MEIESTIRCREEDRDLVESVVTDAKKEFEAFLKEKTGKVVDISLKLDSKNLGKADCEIGGIVLYCYNNSIVFRNTLDSRLDLCFQESAPFVRNRMFPDEKHLQKTTPAE